MNGFLATAGALILMATASVVTAADEPDYPGPGSAPEAHGLEYPAHSHPMPPAYPMSRPYPYAGPPRIHLEKDRYEEGYLLRVYTQGIAPEDIEVVADRGRLRLHSDMSRQREWNSDQPYRRSSMSSRSSIRRTVRLPYDADASKLTSGVEEGVLEIRIPRM